ncbi:MAG TPA: 50S ribosomal protein L9 [Longimicrobiales bacterium]|nr:50S ribosomal protein L9 [Longimicrobiales bacterium]
MKSTNVILRQDVPNVGDAGDLVTVKPGFARNFLLPRGLAFEATEANIRRLEEDRQREEERTKRDFLEARRRASALEQVSLTFTARAGEESKLFGSITTADIAEKLNAEGNLGFEVDRRQIELDEPIKSLGVFNVPVKLHGDVRPEIKVWIIKDE